MTLRAPSRSSDTARTFQAIPPRIRTSATTPTTFPGVIEPPSDSAGRRAYIRRRPVHPKELVDENRRGLTIEDQGRDTISADSRSAWTRISAAWSARCSPSESRKVRYVSTKWPSSERRSMVSVDGGNGWGNQDADEHEKADRGVPPFVRQRSNSG